MLAEAAGDSQVARLTGVQCLSSAVAVCGSFAGFKLKRAAL